MENGLGRIVVISLVAQNLYAPNLSCGRAGVSSPTAKAATVISIPSQSVGLQAQ